MRALFLTRAWPTGGGTEVWLDTLVGSLRAGGLSADVAVATGPKFNRSGPFYESGQFIRSAYEIDGSSGWSEGRRHQVRRILRELKPDIVIPLRLLDGLVAAAQEKARGEFRIVYPLHEYRAGYFQDLIEFGNWIDRVVVCDELSRLAVAEVAGVGGERIEVIPQGVEVANELPTRVESGVIELGYAGRLENPQKRVSDLAGVCEHLVDLGTPFHLRISGSGPEEAALRRQLAPFIEQGLVEMEGWRASADLARDFYPRLDALLVTSRWETGPIVAWEAMAAGALLVTSRFRGIEAARFLTHEQNCLIFEVGDCAGAAEQVVRAFREPELRRRLAQRGWEDVGREKSLGAVAGSWRCLLEQLLIEPAGARESPPPAICRESSRLGRLGVPVVVVELAKRVLGRQFLHESPGEEWPFHASPEPELGARLTQALEDLDRRPAWFEVP